MQVFFGKKHKVKRRREKQHDKENKNKNDKPIDATTKR